MNCQTGYKKYQSLNLRSGDCQSAGSVRLRSTVCLPNMNDDFSRDAEGLEQALWLFRG
jgi:hypothetical protein